MINEKIDHHFNELTPIDFNIFQGVSLYKKLINEDLNLDKANALQDHIRIIKEQIESILNQEDEHLAVIYNFLTKQEQEYYLSFLNVLNFDMQRYLKKITAKSI
ncbi:MAG: hypothetical protein HN583_01355 [Kordiimonadaceae bacterium]|jgi:hypothetical protein|nr:hypothetical protein [Kordiimonadaceae bacterium]MDA9619286.1 hypothetical protein [Alphaproteobacteria bacterium]MDB4044181.1 hypothetical protein [Emcibacteraceae bacterium]MBT6466368.1 hypothetical protein [Kordiimonadaceae bacterium]MBT7544116.1 hypothetical protein [Kordiimonadaceae bacterium]|tara:strand:- start:7107 stop:7418 length:312 start_codon:yes stop_codon:yes gene_type:complete